MERRSGCFIVFEVSAPIQWMPRYSRQAMIRSIYWLVFAIRFIPWPFADYVEGIIKTTRSETLKQQEID